MKYLYKVILMLGLFIATTVSAQQDPSYTMYRYSMNLINPAYAGANETIDFGASVRSQWSNVKGAPETQSFIFGIPLGKNVGLGLSIINDKTFIENQTSVALDFSYLLKLNDNYDLYFGIKAGLNSYDANTRGLITYSIEQDPNLMNLSGQLNPNIGAGVYLKHNDCFISFSVPRILSPDRLEEENGIATVGTDKVHVYLSGGYNFIITENIILKPSVLIRHVEASPLSIDLTALLEFNKYFDLGAAYRIDESISGLLMFKASNALQIGYAYETPLENSIRSIDNGTHEVLMRLSL
ncbi:type IX secretion system membrane protein PorP/SprF [Bizionia saleffrena]|uniref:Type IX secretion system membrane protein PorP/SprF n=1 Tax=Bizionia saleffrena TaxID=291189 RepID=A0A8H2QK12_9FLAO|nr:type IX secretion system membrane protein PorP/SprF [Bizionia saleffrena]TYB77266.1 type IX secretion system membrane protein PorP/SprF [Bizionia saleffrena]